MNLAKTFMRFTKVLFYLFPVFLMGCRSDAEETDSATRLSAIITQIKGITVDTVSFDYDTQNRVIRSGLEHFTYGQHGKIVSSRIHSVLKKGISTHEFIKESTYHWDAQGRLETIKIDSLLRKKTVDQSGQQKQIEMDLWKDITAAKFQYQGTNRRPSKIVYRSTYHGDLIFRESVLSEEKNQTYTYNRENIIYREEYDFFIDQKFYDSPIFAAMAINTYSFERYSDRPHYLNEIYQQMGFNPLAIQDVIPANQQESRVTTEKNKTDIALYTPDWSKADQYQTVYNSRGLPIEITVPSKSLANGYVTLEQKIILKYSGR